MLCGVGTGKSYTAGYISYKYIQRFNKVKGFIGANFYQQLDKATLERCKEVWASFGLKEYTNSNAAGVYVVNKQPPAHFVKDLHQINDYRGVISWINGAVIFTGSMDNAVAHDGKQFGWLILDETKDTKEEDVKGIMIPRVRQKGMYIDKNGVLYDKKTNNNKSFNPVYLLTTPAKLEWLNKMFSLDKHISEIESSIYDKDNCFVLDSKNSRVVIASTYHNAHNLPENYIDNIIATNTEERIRNLIYGNPFSVSGGEFYSSFSRLNNISEDAIYDPALPIHVSFDQNTVPYNSCSIWQIIKKDDFWLFNAVGEIALKNPNNSTEDVCDAILMQFGDCPFLFYYGDASGYNRSTLTKGVKHHYEVIERVLSKKLINGSKRTVKKNPSLKERRDVINCIFENKSNIIIKINPNCTNLIADLTYMKQDIDGTKKKEIHTNKETGERYEKYGHLSDTMDYFIMFINKIMKI